MTDPVHEGTPEASASAFGRWLPAPAVAGFVLLLAVLFAVSYAAGAVAGPVAPGMRPIHGDPGGPKTGEHGEGHDTHGLRLPPRQEAGR
ncbi:hypothetical protein DB35_25305 [Streptomyces abyssalis]|uniref:Uncharacterized protein n=1 Tax=Streptomyces abyssalis TaxID=933944 RepID=A0A1E7JN50_9ACTN|nr:hypothetical protein [Streptomyces abyssalis]OEU86908.1 hypothetical protein DB35_25305 [Streptomyces abyssalis]OEU89707.1 hypothetical protein AN215_08260 [Streptomyces abyssalis]OEV31318.1 hypothetical protein AN219_05620 [Streptomyces nanshensis]